MSVKQKSGIRNCVNAAVSFKKGFFRAVQIKKRGEGGKRGLGDGGMGRGGDWVRGRLGDWEMGGGGDGGREQGYRNRYIDFRKAIWYKMPYESKISLS